MTKLSPPEKQKIIYCFSKYIVQANNGANSAFERQIQQKPSLMVCNPLLSDVYMEVGDPR